MLPPHSSIMQEPCALRVNIPFFASQVFIFRLVLLMIKDERNKVFAKIISNPGQVYLYSLASTSINWYRNKWPAIIAYIILKSSGNIDLQADLMEYSNAHPWFIIPALLGILLYQRPIIHVWIKAITIGFSS